ncbi:MAG TPA: hypothetical protein VFO10_19030 [Oligoflexus sp.]|uniref:hypothetical protein n=1 Tax=Oligoflexus sp. TaxID=1971216 RepID=UPI002D7EF562|nr:hypothetical protein [Oligoflexus sp.]HET9239363.1 hypothetical protein [Oligoflexus sp.]
MKSMLSWGFCVAMGSMALTVDAGALPRLKIENLPKPQFSVEQTDPVDDRTLAQATPPPPSGSAPGTGTPVDPNELPPPVLPKKASYSDAEVKAECRKFEGKFIAYYDRVFKVEGCKRREVVSDDDEANPALKGHRVIPVENITIAKIPEGPAIGSSPKGKKPNCAKIEGRYIISRASDVFYVEKCKKRPFPDWDTYADHAAKHPGKAKDILELPEEEFLALPVGTEFPSSLNDEYKKMLVTEKNVDVLPLDEACKGLNGSYVSYYAKIYKIEKCRKHEVDAERFLMRFPSYKLREMSSEQWVSIPTGKPVKL